jgi:hypothetical protein
VRGFADGFIVGSALGRLIEEQGSDPGLPQGSSGPAVRFARAA